MLLAVNAWPLHSVSRVKCKTNQKNASHKLPWTRDQNLRVRRRLRQTLKNSSQRAVGRVEDSETKDRHNESKRARTTGGMEVCVPDDNCDEWLEEPGQMLEDQEGSGKGDVDRRNRVPFCPSAEEGLISEKQVYAMRSGEPMCHDAVRKSTR